MTEFRKIYGISTTFLYWKSNLGESNFSRIAAMFDKHCLCPNRCVILCLFIQALADLVASVVVSLPWLKPLDMGSAELFSLKWNDFVTNITSSFVDLRKGDDFTDVTLACEGNQIAAHKVILSSGSQFFKTLLTQNKHPHPLIYLKGIKSRDLKHVVDFLYHGEVNILQEDLNGFLETAEELNLKGLAGSSGAGSPENDLKEMVNNKSSSAAKQLTRNPTKYENKMLESPKYSETSNNIVSVLDGEVGARSSVTFKDGNDELETKILSLMTNIDGAWTCTVCGKSDRKNRSNIKKHIESCHIEGVSIECSICGKLLRSKNALQTHIFRNHKL